MPLISPKYINRRQIKIPMPQPMMTFFMKMPRSLQMVVLLFVLFIGTFIIAIYDIFDLWPNVRAQGQAEFAAMSFD